MECGEGNRPSSFYHRSTDLLPRAQEYQKQDRYPPPQCSKGNSGTCVPCVQVVWPDQERGISGYDSLGMSVSYDRLHAILTDRAAHQYQHDEIVCPMNLEKNCFTTGQIDNIDRDTTSATAVDSFHGTAISLMQHGPPGNCLIFFVHTVLKYILSIIIFYFLFFLGEKRVATVDSQRQRKIADLPVKYSVVHPLDLEPKSVQCPAASPTHPEPSEETRPSLLESEWRENSTANNWPGHHSQGSLPCQCRTRFAILPLFRKKSASLSMMAHGLHVIIKATKLLNPLQVQKINTVKNTNFYEKKNQLFFRCQLLETRHFMLCVNFFSGLSPKN